MDASVMQRPFIWIKLMPDDGMDAIASNGDRSFTQSRYCITASEESGNTILVLIYAHAFIAKMDTIGADALAHRVQQHELQIAAMDGKLRPTIARAAPARITMNELAMSVVKVQLARFDRDPGEVLLKPKFRKFAYGVRKKIDAQAKGLNLGRAFKDLAWNACLMKAESQCQAAYTAADDDHIHCF